MKRDDKLYNVLVIEDNAGDFIIVEEFLTEQILTPVIVNAFSFKEAAGLLPSAASFFDVILLDLTLPDKNGQELITEMLKIAGSCPIIILTGYANIDFSIDSISQGIMDYLLKDDLNPTTLYKSILYAIERKKIYYEIKKSEKQYSDLFRLSPQPMYVYDLETLRFVQVNQAAIEHYGYSEAEFLNMSILEIRPADEGKKIQEIIYKHTHDSDGSYNGKVIHTKKSGEIIEVEVFSSPIVINQKKLTSVIAIDVTQKTLYEHKITRAIIKTQEDERYDIGSELHDNVCQILATSQITLGMIKESLTPEGMPWFNQCQDYIRLASDEIRNLSHRLAPAFFDDTTLDEAFTRLFDNFNVAKKYTMWMHFDKEAKLYPIKRDIQLNLYRILQEQLRNILKYAKAKRIEVEVLIRNGKLYMTINDDGIGFDVDTVKGGIGIANMKRRTELFSGKLEIISSPGKGCKIIVEIPLDELT